ncbi:hypothetical protein Ga0102493_112342 [Erythrobacter litoralis]|jgi:hypothetical protein|uniref:ATP synthase I n=1 Tax=Erythrobacter litoralis TaxID=39960 RepID=A0A074N3H0_9SPHN|nr:hypothetical protein [Erythrobacter litoralis]AOL23357.1 hypothetical protein Ga0102493_112342 [Erythrobacter litoralis]KEO92497.1 hypothetical protein EH32_14655 [Erythrobacter litoralis]MEE4339237.1 hypothetical protein [Erythrobacter sp.]
MKYSVRTRTRLPLLFAPSAMFVAYFLPFANQVQTAIFGIAVGAIAGFASRGAVERRFDPPDAPAGVKRRIVVALALSKLVFGLLLMLLSILAFADWLATPFTVLGGYLAGTTAATPLSRGDFEARR